MHATQHQSIALPIPLIRIQVLLGIEVFPTSEWRFEHGCRSSCIPSHLSTSWDLVLGGGRSSGGGVLPLAEAYAIGYCFADVKEDALDIIVSEALLEAEWPAVILLGGEPQTVVLALNSPQFPEQRCLGWFRPETMHEGLLSFSAVEERAVHVVVSRDADDLAAGYLCSGLQAWGEGCVIAKELWEPGRWSAAMVQVVNPISSQHSKEPIVPKTLSVNRRRAAVLPMQRGAGVGVDSVLVHYVLRINVADGHVTVTPLANGMESLHRGSTQKVTQGIFCIRIIRLQRCFTQICDLHTLVWLSVLEGRDDSLIVGSPTILFWGPVRHPGPHPHFRHSRRPVCLATPVQLALRVARWMSHTPIQRFQLPAKQFLRWLHDVRGGLKRWKVSFITDTRGSSSYPACSCLGKRELKSPYWLHCHRSPIWVSTSFRVVLEGVSPHKGPPFTQSPFFSRSDQFDERQAALGCHGWLELQGAEGVSWNGSPFTELS